jgi:hypothetical protein
MRNDASKSMQSRRRVCLSRGITASMKSNCSVRSTISVTRSTWSLVASWVNAARFDARITNHDVVELVCQPQSLRDGIAENSGEARTVKHLTHDLATANRLAGKANRLAAGSSHQVIGVQV